MKDSPHLSLDAFWPYQAVVLGDLISKHTHGLLKDIGEVNLSQWRVLAAIGDSPGLSAAQVVAKTPMDKGIVSRAVTFLMDGNYIRRKSDATDKRKTALFLTSKGKNLHTKISRAQMEAIATFQSEQVNDPEFNALLTDRINRMRQL